MAPHEPHDARQIQNTDRERFQLKLSANLRALANAILRRLITDESCAGDMD
jgi:hypothetical protein